MAVNARNILLLLLALVAVAPMGARGDAPPEAAEPVPAAEPAPIPVAEITARAESARELLRKAEAKMVSDQRVTDIQQALPGERERIAELVEQTAERVQSSGPVAAIQELEKASIRARDRLARWLKDLSSRSSGLESMLEELREEIALWELTQAQGSREELPREVVEQISRILERLHVGEEGLRSARDKLLALQASISQEQNTLSEILARQGEEIANRRAVLISLDSPPLWAAFGAAAHKDGLFTHLDTVFRAQLQDLRHYLADQTAPVLFWLAMWVVLVVELGLHRRRAMKWMEQDSVLADTVAVLHQPVLVAAAIVMVLANIFQLQAPTAWIDTMNLILLLALAGLLPRMLPRALRPAPYLLVPLFLLYRLVALLPLGSTDQRLGLVVLPLAGMALCWWFGAALRQDPGRLSPPWQRAVAFGLRLAVLLFAVGLAANVVGSVRFSGLVVTGTVDALLTALVFWVVDALLKAMVRAALLTPAARRLGIAPDHSEKVRKSLFRLVTLLATIFFAGFLLRGYGLFDTLAKKVERALEWGVSIGDVSIVPGSFLIFAFVIWVSIKLAALVEFSLDVMVLPRFQLPRGLPHTISRMNRYLVIVLGAAVATAATGLDVSKATILVGALGVGVGFGLQNVVSNFVSGLILLFERPIRVGDIVELADASGEVEEIGMRATMIRTWQGAELIVPNANLVSADVVNWTLKSDRRRLEIPVGVEYGSDAEEVARLLIAVASQHREVCVEPPPQCLFKGFGDSSLDFELRAWVPATSTVGIGSELRFAIIRALKDAGITIPFPQRDLHLRSSETGASLPQSEQGKTPAPSPAEPED